MGKHYSGHFFHFSWIAFYKIKIKYKIFTKPRGASTTHIVEFEMKATL